jgi:hypothetical protein
VEGKVQSLADYLGTSAPTAEPSGPVLEDISNSEEFAKALLNSREFRCYIVNGLVLGCLPPAVLIRVMDLAGWMKPPDRVEHTGKDGGPIAITKIVREIVDPKAPSV